MGRRRGFFAEIQHQNKLAAKRQAAAQREWEREQRRAVREAEKARKAEERARIQFAKASEAERKRLAKAAQAAHVERMNAEANQLNLELSHKYAEIDGLLAATINVDDFVDLDSLKESAQHPPFNRPDLEVPVAVPILPADPPQPVFFPPAEPTGLGKLFSKDKHAKAVEAAQVQHRQDLATWQRACQENESNREAASRWHADQERQRKSALADAKAEYAVEFASREKRANERNEAIDKLKTDLSYGAVDAVEIYITIVLSNSVYPDCFPVEHEFSFEPATAELNLRVLLPQPDQVPGVKAYKYTKSSDTITSTALSQKARRDRYAGAVHQTALRTLHEVFEADRRAIIRSISLEVGTEATDPALGTQQFMRFVAVAAERDAFLQIELANVVPQATLEHLGAALSKNPYGLVTVGASGVRMS